MAAAVYLLTSVVFFACADRATLVEHTRWNHFALQAEAWLAGQVHLEGGPPAYAGYNDFARFEGRWFVVFPPFPALLLVPLVWLGGSATRVQDGQFFIWLAGIAPAVLFLALEKLRRGGQSSRSVADNVALALLFAFGTVYFFTAEQGTVWYAAHVVGAGLTALYLLFSLDAERPVLAGTMIGLGLLTRAPLLLAAPLFVSEAVRVCRRDPSTSQRPAGRVSSPRSCWNLDWRRLLVLAGSFAAPVAIALGVVLGYNALRFGNAFDFGYEHLQVAWQGRMQKWGLFHYHYLARNLGVVLTGLPYLPAPGTQTGAPFQINGHGLALWVTSPFLLWLLWPRNKGAPHGALWLTVVAIAMPTLCYQNSGWVQFGYRFSNDYAVFLVAALAIGGHRLRGPLGVAAVWAVVVNLFGAVTFGRAEYSDYYFIEPTQRIIYQPD